MIDKIIRILLSKKNKRILKNIDKILPLSNIYFSFKQEIIRKILINPPPYGDIIHNFLISSRWDPIRYATLSLIINTIKNENIEGCFAELGVYKGETSQIIHLLAPERKFFLFDTFEGFPIEYIEINNDKNRFKDTNLKVLMKNLGDLNNIIIKKGIFPETAKGLESEIFSFVHIDLDLYISTMKALEFFYPRVSKGGFILIHDYNNPFESNLGVKRAVKEFMKDKVERLIEFPDIYGSAVIRKVYY